jgi:polyisoprenoid-binding protein YceI
MKKIILNSALITFVALSYTSCKEKNKDEALQEISEVAEATAEASGFSVDVAKSEISWKGQKPTGTHNGTIKLSSGIVAAVNGELQAGTFTIDMNSIANLDLDGDMKASLENHLKGTVEGKEGDFFDVTKYPTATFELTGVEDENGNITVKGNLTIKDKTNPVAFPAVISFTDDTMTLKSSPFMIDRTKWGVNYGSKTIFGDLGDKFINDEIELVIQLYATKV